MLKYDKKYDLRVSDFNSTDYLKPSAILDLCQSIADVHASKIGVGYNDLLEKDLVWVLLRMRYDVVNEVGFDQKTVRAVTWPHRAGKVDFDRDYLIENENGNVLVKASSKWCVINYKTRRIALGKGVAYPEDDYCEDENYVDGLKKLADFDLDGGEEYEGFAGVSCLDHNGHVNNIKYSDFILDAIGKEDRKIKSFEINYIKEMQMGNFKIVHKFIQPENENTPDKRLIKGFSNGEEAFRAVVTYKKR